MTFKELSRGARNLLAGSFGQRSTLPVEVKAEMTNICVEVGWQHQAHNCQVLHPVVCQVQIVHSMEAILQAELWETNMCTERWCESKASMACLSRLNLWMGFVEKPAHIQEFQTRSNSERWELSFVLDLFYPEPHTSGVGIRINASHPIKIQPTPCESLIL